VDMMKTLKGLFERINYYAFENHLDNEFAKKE
ncbi:methylisocitrate lyase, partial [Acinetobacter baumannii]